MDIEQFQAIEKQLAEQAEANHITNDNLANLIWMMSTRESKNIATTPLALIPIPQLITTTPRASQPSRIRPMIIYTPHKPWNAPRRSIMRR
jgi:hypothetical protein